MRGRHGWGGQLRGLGYKATLSRGAVLSVLSMTNAHLSAKEIFLKVQKTCPACGLNTVYRTLDMLVQVGMVLKSDFGDGQSRYELSLKENRKSHHHHLVCVKCGKVLDYEDFVCDETSLFGGMIKGVSEQFKFKITDHEITFKGFCKNCVKL